MKNIIILILFGISGFLMTICLFSNECNDPIVVKKYINCYDTVHPYIDSTQTLKWK